jgi:hypothetical protein
MRYLMENYTLPYSLSFWGFSVFYNRYSAGLLSYQAGRGSQPARPAYQATLFGRRVDRADGLSAN